MEILIEADEIKEIVISIVAISLAFTLVFGGLESAWNYPEHFAIFMLIAMATVGSGFVLHEMAHKITAISYGGRSRFRMWGGGLLFMLIMSLFGVLFAAPGAVYIYAPHITKRQNGIISVAGPAANVLLAFLFLLASAINPIKIYFPFLEYGKGVNVWYFGAQINLLLAMFNMIPAFPLDGSKVFAWNKAIWLGLTICLLAIQALFFSPLFIISWAILLILFFILSMFLFGRRRAGD